MHESVTENFLPARHCFAYSIGITSFCPQNNPVTITTAVPTLQIRSARHREVREKWSWAPILSHVAPEHRLRSRRVLLPPQRADPLFL